MPKNKKKWIDNKHSVKFHLVRRNQNTDGNGDEHVQQRIEKENMDERIKYGIYFDDNYNYLKHLKGRDEVSENELSRSVAQAPSGSAVHFSFEANGYEFSLDSLKQAERLGLKLDIDPDLITDTDIECGSGELDDDFVLLANGGELPSLQPPQPFSSLGKVEFRKGAVESDENSDDESEQNSYDGDNGTLEEEEAEEEEEEDTCVGVENSEKLRPIDEKFEKFCEEYNESSDEETDEEEEGYLLDPNSDRMKMLAEEFKNQKAELVLERDEFARRYAEIDETEEATEELERIAIVCPDKKKAKWDCETIVTAYTNIYNRPALIVDSSRKRKLKPVLKQIERMDETRSTVSKASVSTRRTHGETTEERKIRKAAVKAMRADRRAEKKCNKLAFKEERKKLTAQIGLPIKTVPIV